MFDPKTLDEVVKRLADSLPPGLHHLQEEIQKNFKAVLQAAFSKANLVSRDEFEVQRAVLLRTREKLETLETEVRRLEEKLLKR